MSLLGIKVNYVGSVCQLPRVTREEMEILVLLLSQTHCLLVAEEGAQGRTKLQNNVLPPSSSLGLGTLGAFYLMVVCSS